MWRRLAAPGLRVAARQGWRPWGREAVQWKSTAAPSSAQSGPGLGDFIAKGLREQAGAAGEAEEVSSPVVPYLEQAAAMEEGQGRVLVETYGCQMNFSDTEIVMSVMKGAGYGTASGVDDADIVLLNTCAIRDNAESKVWNRLVELRSMRRKRTAQRRRALREGTAAAALPRELKVGVLGCMAERLKERLLEQEQLCDLVAGPDAYRDLPRLLGTVQDGEQAINVILSQDETYADITPVRPATNSVSAYVSIMRGCNNMCSYCIVPFTRGRERSRDVTTIEQEVRQLSDQGYKEVILLGQNVNSYRDGTTPGSKEFSNSVIMADGFSSIVKVSSEGVRFAELLDRVSRIDPEMRVRFTSPHPKDFPDHCLHLISERPNVCNSLHMPAQSGSSRVLEAMRRGYTREAYVALVDRVRETIPGCSISSDFISGFCGETEEDHQMTLSLMEHVQFEMAFMFAYSLREKTRAHRRLQDDVPEDVKQRRLSEVIALFYSLIEKKNKAELGAKHLVLVDGNSRRSDEEFVGRTDTNKKVVFPKQKVFSSLASTDLVMPTVGDYVVVDIVDTGLTLRGTPSAVSSIQEFEQHCNTSS